MATNVGHGAAYIRLLPDTTGFKAAVQSKLAAIQVEYKVKLVPDLTGFRAALRAQLKALPPAKIRLEADGTHLRASVKAAIAALPNGKVNIRANLTGNAFAQLTRVEALASAIDGRRITLDVSITGGVSAVTDLTAIRHALKALDGKTATITINLRPPGVLAALAAIGAAAQGSAGRLGLLANAAILFGSAAIPALTAAAAAAVSLGGALISVAAGAGVGILALTGVVGAVGALNKAQSERAKASALASRQDRQNAGAADQIRSALAGVTSAERNLTNAKRDALRAEEDVTRARKEAREALLDLDSQVKGNAISIRRANLDLVDAQKALAAVMDLPVDDRRRVEAQLAYDEAAQQLDDLKLRSRRLGDEQASSAKKGINGSDQVVSAQERVRDANERVADAASSLAQARQAVIAAQRAAATAAITTASTAGAAMDALAEKLAGLSPAGEKFARFLFGLKPAMLALRQESEEGFLPGLQAGLERLTIYLPKVEGFIRKVGEELGSLAERGARALAGPQFRAFFTYIDSTATHTLEQFGRAVGNTALGIANLAVAFLPVQRQVTGGLVDMTARFAKFSESLKTSKGFQEFIDYVQTRGPHVLETIGDLAGALIHLGRAAAPIGDIILGALQALSAVIKAIPVPILTGLVGVFLALRAATFAAAIPLAGIGSTLATLPARLIAATTSFGAFRALLGSFVGFLGGPWAIGMIAATAAIGYFVAKNSEAKQRVEAARQAFQQFGETLKDGLTPASLENAQAMLRQNKELGQLVQFAKEAGISQQLLVKALNGEASAREVVIEALNKQIGLEFAQRAQRFAELGYNDDLAQKYQKRAEELTRLRDAFEKASAEEERNNIITQILALEQDDLADAMKDGATAADLLRKAYRELNGESISRQEALEAEREAFDNLKEAIERNGPTLDENTEGGRENNRLVRERIESINDLAAADIAATGQISAETQKRIDNMKRELLQLGFTQKEVDELLGLYQKIPPKIVSEIIIKGGGDAVRGLNEIGKAAANLIATYGVSVDEALLIAKGGVPPSWRGPTPSQIAQGKADGGYIAGPGGPRDDVIPAWLSNGEFVMPAHTVSKYGVDFMEDIRAGRAGRDHVYAAGGPVEVKSSTNVKDWRQYPKFISRTTAMTTDLKRVLEEHRQAQMFYGGFGGSGGEQYVNDVSRTAFNTAQSLNATAKVMLALMESGIVESGMRNLDYGDRDSVGFLQQRPSQGWPDPMNVGTATRSFVVRAAPKDKLFPNQSAGTLAQRVQVSAFPLKYDQVEPAARSVIGIISGKGVGTLSGGGSGAGFPPWPKSPGAQRGDSGVWRNIVNLIKSTGPASGSFGNAYRPGDPLWHGSGRAVDWMGFDQDYLASFIAAQRPLELIHRTKNRDYAYTRGINKGSFNQTLMNQHRNHIHAAFADGGLVDCPGCSARSGLVSFDRGGDLLPGVTPAYNGTAGREYVATTRADMANVELADVTIEQLAAAIFSPYNLARLAQTLNARPVFVAVDGQVLASTVSDKLAGSLADAGIGGIR